MRIFVGVTDGVWFRFLQARPGIGEINFWLPSARGFHALAEGELFLFKLKYPQNVIAGGGVFQDARRLPLSLAWDAYEEGNGMPDLPSLWRRIAKYRPGLGLADEIGCVMLRDPFYFEPHDHIPAPPDWARNIVAGKTYIAETEPGRSIFEQVQLRLRGRRLGVREAADDMPMFGEPALVRPRLGQSGFRVLVTETYQRHCAVTDDKILPVLEAAHIRPVAEGGTHRVDNGLLLRRDVHRLFDRGYITVSSKGHRVRVSSRLREEFDNGEYYRQFDGRAIRLPDNVVDRPSPEFLEWHGDVVYQD